MCYTLNMDLSVSSLTLAPGANANATLVVSSTASTPASTYNVIATATNATAPTFVGSASSGYSVVTSSCVTKPPTLKLSPSTQTTSKFRPVNYKISILNNDTTSCPQRLFRFSASASSQYLKTFMEPYNILVPAGKPKFY